MVPTRSALETTWLMVISKPLCRLKICTLRLSVQGASPVLEALRLRDGIEPVECVGCAPSTLLPTGSSARR